MIENENQYKEMWVQNFKELLSDISIYVKQDYEEVAHKRAEQTF